MLAHAHSPASSENRLQSAVRGDISTCFRTPGKNEPVKKNKLLFLYSVLNKSGWCHDICGAEAKKVCSLIFNSDKVLILRGHLNHGTDGFRFINLDITFIKPHCVSNCNIKGVEMLPGSSNYLM